MTSYNGPTTSTSQPGSSPNQTGSDNASHFCGCTRLRDASSVVRYLQCGCYREELSAEDSQCQHGNDNIDVSNITESDVNVVAPSTNAVSEDILNDVTDCGINIAPSSSDNNITTSAEINVTDNEMNGHTTPGSASSATLVTDVDIINDEASVTPSPDTDTPPSNDEAITALSSQDVNISTM